MKPINSLHKHEPENGDIGDCDRACIASILELTTFEVPHWFGETWPNTEAGCELKRTWLQSIGYDWIELPFTGCPIEQILEYAGRHAPGVYHTLLGKSKKGFGHIVVCRDGAIVHDPTYGMPHGIRGPADDDDNPKGLWWLGFLAAKQ